jgi:hypothetical protein
MKTLPVSGYSNPAIILSVVVLPQPEGPNKTKNSPFLIDRFTSRTAIVFPNFLLILINLI